MAESREVIEEDRKSQGKTPWKEGLEIRRHLDPEITGTVLMEGEQSKEGKRSVWWFAVKTL